MGRIFVWEASTRGGMALVYQPAIYYDHLPTKLSGEPKDEGTFILVHHERPEEEYWGLFSFTSAYPCPAERKVKIGESYDTQIVQSSKDFDQAQTGERVARYLSGNADSWGNGGSGSARIDQADERSAPDISGYDTERIGGNGSETQSSEIHSTGEGKTQDGMASNNRNLQIGENNELQENRLSRLRRRCAQLYKRLARRSEHN